MASTAAPAVTELARLAEILSAAEREASGRIATLDLLGRDGEDVLGRLTAENGRLCWAMARDQTPRISDIFAEECGVPRTLLEETFQAARERGTPFGEELVARSLVGEDDLRRCLRRQMVTALLWLCRSWPGGAGYRVSTTERISYDPAFTAAPLALLLDCVSQLPELGGAVRELPPAFRALAPRLGAALCFVSACAETRALVPVAASNAGALSVGGALDVGRDAMAVVAPPALQAAEIRPYAVLVHRDGEGLVVSWSGSHVCVFEVQGRDQYGELLAHLVAEHRSRRDAALG